MAQLVQLNKSSEKFKEANVEIIVTFREESKGVEGLEAIKEKTKVPFTLALDTPADKTKRYSPEKMRFDNYVIDKNGIITAIIEGDLRNRAKADELLKEIAKLKSADKESQDKESQDTEDDDSSQEKESDDGKLPMQ